MKKILVLLFLLSFALPVCAANWKQIAEKEYVDLDSIEKYTDVYNSRNNNIYSFWIKSLNDKTSFFTDYEKSYNKKIWYKMTRNLIDCKNKTITLKSITIYDLKRQVIDTYEVPDYAIKWNSIIPDSVGEGYYYGVCQP